MIGSFHPIKEETIHTERLGNTIISIIKYTERYPGAYADETAYTAYLEHDSSQMETELGNYATEYETYSYGTRKDALDNARFEAADLNKHLDKYWL